MFAMGILCMGNSLWCPTAGTNAVGDHGQEFSSVGFDYPMNSAGTGTGVESGSLKTFLTMRV